MLDYYNQEKTLLASLGKQFALRHPGVAPLLGSGSVDPDVERLLEGLSFLSANLRHKIDDEFPELTDGLLHLVAPHFLRPIPSATVMQFSPAVGSSSSIRIPAASEIASVPIEGVRCVFRTSTELYMQPLTLSGVDFVRPDLGEPELVLSFTHLGGQLDAWEAGPLRVFINGLSGYAENLFYLLTKKSAAISIRSGGKEVFQLPSSSLRLPGFDDNNELFPYPSQALRAHRILMEYMAFPAKFRFLEFTGLEKWTGRGAANSFQIVFRFSRDVKLDDLRKAKPENFLINTVEAANLHTGWTCPITLDHHRHEYRLSADFNSAESFQIFSVDSVCGIASGGNKQRVYQRAEHFMEEEGASRYTLSMRANPVSDIPEVFLSVLYGSGAYSERETLSIAATFTVPDLPARLNIGDIRLSTGTSPVAARARNVIPPTRGSMPPQGRGLFWKLIALMSANYLALADEKCLQSLLETFSYVSGKDEGKRQEILMQAKSISKVSGTPCDLARRGMVLRGMDIVAQTTGEGFESEGMLHIYGMVLDIFFGSVMRLNHFSRFTLHNKVTGNRMTFPPRLGQLQEL